MLIIQYVEDSPLFQYYYNDFQKKMIQKQVNWTLIQKTFFYSNYKIINSQESWHQSLSLKKIKNKNQMKLSPQKMCTIQTF